MTEPTRTHQSRQRRRLSATEVDLGRARGCNRVKIAEREALLKAAREAVA